MRKPFAALFALALVAGLAACGDDGDDGGSTTTTETTAAAPDVDDTTTDDTSADDTTDTPAGADEQAYVDAIAANLSSGDEADGQFVISEDDAPCVAEGWVDIVGVDTLVAAGVDPDELADPASNFNSAGLELDVDQGRQMVAVTEDCGVDLLGQFRAVVAQGLDPEEVDCLNDELDDDLLTEFIAEALVADEPSPDLQAELERIDTACSLS